MMKKLNTFQQTEVDSHKDQEFLWIIHETIDLFRTNSKNFDQQNKFNRFHLYKSVAPVIVSIINEREKCQHSISDNDAAEILLKTYRSKFPEGKQPWKTWDELVLPFVDELINLTLLKCHLQQSNKKLSTLEC